MSKPHLYVKIMDAYGVAVVHGPEAAHVTRSVAPESRKWSAAGKGWLVSLDTVADIEAFASYYHLLCVVYRPKRGKA